jgi:predicted acyl esterase
MMEDARAFADLAVVARDGVALATDVYLPAGEAR